MTSSESQPRTSDWRENVDDVIGYALLETEHVPGFARRGPSFREKLAEAGWKVVRLTDGAQDSRVGVERLARALDLWERRADPEDESISALLGVDIYENGSVEVAQGIVAEYARLAAEKPHD